MTRINTIKPENLTDQHLLAEIRELPRIPGAVADKIKLGTYEDPKIDSYRLGTGHVKFFYNKIEFLERRYYDLVYEAKLRGFNIAAKDDGRWEMCHGHECFNNWEPTEESMSLNSLRIAERVLESTMEPRYYGAKIDRRKYVSTFLDCIVFK